MNLQAIYARLIESLEKLNDGAKDKKGKYNLSDDSSIFINGNKYSIDDLNSILTNEQYAMDFDGDGNGELSESEINEFLKSLENENIPITFEIEETQDVENSDSKDESQENEVFDNDTDETVVTEILDKIYSDKKAQKLLDIDDDGKVSNQEKEIFERHVKGDDDKLSAKKLQKVLSEIKDGTYVYSPEEEVPEEEKVKKGKTNQHASNTASFMPSSSASYSGGGAAADSGGSHTVNGTQVNQIEQKSVASMSLEELEAEKSTRQGNVEKAQNAINDVNNGSNANVAAAQQELDGSKEAYENALKNDENVSDELKEKQSENLSQIETSQNKINDIEGQIGEKNSNISDTKNIISADEANISALESVLQSLSASESDDAEKNAEITQKRNAAEHDLSNAKEQKTEHENQLKEFENQLNELENSRNDEKENLQELENERSEIETEIQKTCSDETKAALESFDKAKENVETVKASELSAAQNELSSANAALQEVNEAINAANAKNTQKEYSVNDLENYEKLYETMGLEEQGLNPEVFNLAMEGYLNLEDKGNGYLGIFDTTQSSDKERYYLLDLNNFELVGRSALKIGSGDMSNISGANVIGSGATLSGFEKIGNEYYSDLMGKNALRIIGLEKGINDNALAKGTVVHYTQYDTTLGCKGFPPVYTNDGQIDYEATEAKMNALFPKGTIIFTNPVYEDSYKELSALYA